MMARADVSCPGELETAGSECGKAKCGGRPRRLAPVSFRFAVLANPASCRRVLSGAEWTVVPRRRPVPARRPSGVAARQASDRGRPDFAAAREPEAARAMIARCLRRAARIRSPRELVAGRATRRRPPRGPVQRARTRGPEPAPGRCRLRAGAGREHGSTATPSRARVRLGSPDAGDCSCRSALRFRTAAAPCDGGSGFAEIRCGRALRVRIVLPSAHEKPVRTSAERLT
jgi:hypothetical protein